jgi:asparagine synthase (glutamine-hydrolysing)
MCGILGLWHKDAKPIPLETFQKATTALRHRGPDDEGYLLVNQSRNKIIPCLGTDSDKRLNLPRIEKHFDQSFDFIFGFRRLSILDLSPSGHQPMSSMDGSCWIIFNGEIYNYLELREELKKLGHTFTSTSDTEVLLAGYLQWGSDLLPRLVGMFAFAIFDMRKRTLFLARDFFGIKPLYYTTTNNVFAFASEAKALLELDNTKRQINPDSLYMYLRYGLTDHGDNTFWNEIQHLPPAHYMEISLEAQSPPQIKRYWQIDMNTRLDISLSDATEQLRNLFLENIRIHLRSDVPVGAALSGGIDSSAIVGAMRHVQGQNLDLHSFSYIANDLNLSEEKWVDLAGEKSEAIVHKTRPQPTDLIEDLDHLIYTLDEPFGSTSIYAQYRVFRLAQENKIKVMLDGQGADEFLGGYNYFLSGYLVSLLRQYRLGASFQFLKNNWRRPYFGGSQLLLRAGAWVLPRRLHGLAQQISGNSLMPDWLNPHWFKEHNVKAYSLYAGDQRTKSKEVYRDLLYQSVVETSLPMLLRYEDRNSMAHSVESRVPFLTPSLVNFIFSLPEEYLINLEGTTKAIFRQSMRDIVPRPILDRKDKIGFSTPEHEWLVSLRPWVESIFESSIASSTPVLNLHEIKDEWGRMLAGQKQFNFRFWRWINLIRWSELYRAEY